MKRVTTGSFLAAPHALVLLILSANASAFLVCLRAGGTAIIPPVILVSKGALTRDALAPGGYWRLFAAGFLHADPSHLLMNLVSLVIVGPFLERRLGGTAFALIYAVSLLGAGLTSVMLHADPFVSVGASGAIFGVMGALFALWALGAEELSPGFFLVNFSLNLAFAAREPRIDWAAHIGGFVAGMAGIALLDMAARINLHWLRCKFPEFVTFNVLMLIAAAAALWHQPVAVAPGLDPRITAAATGIVVALAVVKLLDRLLAARRGLAAAVLVLAAGNGAVVHAACALAVPTLAGSCGVAAALGAWTGPVAPLLCPNLAALPLTGAGCTALLTLSVYAAPLWRGLRDVGFVGATFMGDRRRETGLVRPMRHTRV